MSKEAALSDKLKVLLIGLGGIGCKYDYPKDSTAPLSISDNSKSHLGAILKSGLTLVGGIDTDENSRNLFEKYSLLPTWHSVAIFPKTENIDLVVISSSTISHRDTFQEVINHLRPKGIIVEKPFGSDAKESTSMLKLASTKGIPVRVNYSRNYSQGFYKIRDVIGGDQLVSGQVFYSQGLRRNGSHFLRLILELFGQPLSVIKHDPKIQDLNPSFTLVFSSGSSIQFIGSNSLQVRAGEIALETEKYLVQIEEGMQYWIRLLNEKVIPIEWPTRLELISKGDLGGGIQQIYGDLNWMQSDSYGKILESNYLDNACNEILDGLLASEAIASEASK